jgi:hypothetical protein
MADAERTPPPSFNTPKGVDSTAKVPLHPVPRLTERDVIERTRRYFGHPLVVVEATEETYADCLEETKEWFIDNWGMMRFRVFNLAPGIREIKMTDDVRQVQEISFEGIRLPPLVFERDFPFFANQVNGASPGGVMFSYPTGLYSGIVQQLQWIEQLKRIFSAESDWEYDPITRVLRLFGGGPTGENRMMVEYVSNAMQIEELFGEALNTFQRYFRAEVGERLGQIRSKYDAIPVAGGTATLNGGAMLDWAREEKEKLTEWAHNRNYPYRFLTG